MPTYTYRCKACAKQFEYEQSIFDEPLAKCIGCGGQVHRIITGPVGISYNCLGFYNTDNRS